MKILDRYLLRAMLPIFFGAVAVFVVLLVGHMLYTVIEVVVERGVPLPSVAKFLLLKIPQATAMALPVSVLLAASLTFNRLAADFELPALRAGGASFARLLWPPLVLGLAAGLAVLLLNEQVAPRCEEASGRLLVEAISRQRSLAFQPGRFLQLSDQAWVYPGDTDPHGERLLQVKLFLVRGSDPPALVSAPEAFFTRDKLVVPKAQTLVPEWSGDVTWGSAVSMEIPLVPEAFSLPGGAGELRRLSLLELWRRWRAAAPRSPEQAVRLSLEIHARLAIAGACVVLALLGGPLTVAVGRGQSLSGVGLSLGVVFLYFLGMLWTRLLGERGGLPPVAAAWGENAAILVLTGWLLFRLR
jgi:lipopolysaccharide export LptBFGC system permease protein LptF